MPLPLFCRLPYSHDSLIQTSSGRFFSSTEMSSIRFRSVPMKRSPFSLTTWHRRRASRFRSAGLPILASGSSRLKALRFGRPCRRTTLKNFIRVCQNESLSVFKTQLAFSPPTTEDFSSTPNYARPHCCFSRTSTTISRAAMIASSLQRSRNSIRSDMRSGRRTRCGRKAWPPGPLRCLGYGQRCHRATRHKTETKDKAGRRQNGDRRQNGGTRQVPISRLDLFPFLVPSPFVIPYSQ